MLKKIIFNPIFIYVVWALLMFVHYFRVLHTGYFDEEEEIKEQLGIHLIVGSFGVLVIGMLTLIYRREWYEKYDFIPLAIPLGVVIWLAYTILQ